MKTPVPALRTRRWRPSPSVMTAAAILIGPDAGSPGFVSIAHSLLMPTDHRSRRRSCTYVRRLRGLQLSYSLIKLLLNRRSMAGMGPFEALAEPKRRRIVEML